MSKQRKGFAAMDSDKQRSIARKGGQTAHQKGTAHQFTHDEAVEAGRKGGSASHKRKPDVSDATVPADKTDAI